MNIVSKFIRQLPETKKSNLVKILNQRVFESTNEGNNEHVI